MSAPAQLIAQEQNGSTARWSTPATELIEHHSSLETLINTKLEAHSKNTEISNELFTRNLQVYFARADLPDSELEQKKFSSYLTEAMTAFAGTLYLQAQALEPHSDVISSQAVEKATELLLPSKANPYKEQIFFPDLPTDKQIIIEPYDIDAFLDTGLPWRYLAYALSDIATHRTKAPDTPATENMIQAISRYGVLLLNVAGQTARLEQPEMPVYLSADLLVKAYQQLQQLATTNRHPATGQDSATQTDASRESASPSQSYFTNRNDEWDLHLAHRTSDWLSRLMRGYLITDTNTGILPIPPVFGGSGLAAEDIDGDGLIDLLVLSGSGNHLLKNIGGKFVDITDKAGIDWKRPQDNLPGEPRQPLIADMDNDGDQDIIITYVNDSHRAYRNNGDGTFTDLTDKAQLGGQGLVGSAATVVDINNDGLLDIYISYYGNYLQGVLPVPHTANSNGTANQLFINQGDFVFSLTDDALGSNDKGWSQTVTHTDINQDGWQDLIVGNDFGKNAYFLNKNGQSFVNYTRTLGLDKTSSTTSIGLSEQNKDGLVDFYIANGTESTASSSGDTLFLSVTNENGALQYQPSDKEGNRSDLTGWAWHAALFDADNDGDDDLYVLNGLTDYNLSNYLSNYNPNNYSVRNTTRGDRQRNDSNHVLGPNQDESNLRTPNRTPNVFFINSRERLSNVSAQSGLNINSNSRSAVYSDFDGDGDLDLALNNYHDEVSVFSNNAELLKNNWLQVTLKGNPEAQVNLDAIGAQIQVGFGETGYAWRQVSGSEGHLSAQPKIQHFGLGKADKATVIVIWPNGKRQAFGPLPANNRYILTYEPSQRSQNP
ncbi:CRTAC1 family protein [Oleiphilus messinensis]|nr:CRTAC1 family protein [Oleiphilus messinensis]